METNHVWQQRYLALEQRYLELEQHCTQLSAENQALREKLNTNSNNSSKPPSQDPNRPKRSSSSSGKRPGGQPGHPGHLRKMYPSAQVTTTVDLKPNACPHCNEAQFEETPTSIEVRQVIEMPELSPEVTQYNIHTCRCGRCGKHVRSDIPKEAERGFGPRLMGFVTMLAGEGHLSKRKICSITAHLGLKISLGALCNIHRLSADLLQAPAETIQQFVLGQGKLNADESGWRVLKRPCWIWVGATMKATFFKIDASRSHQAYLRVFGRFQGILTTDRYGAYNEHKGLKQSCLAHIDRHFEKISERSGIDASFGLLLERELDLIFGLWNEFKDGALCREALQKKAEAHVENIKVILIFMAREAKNSKSVTLAHDLLGRFSTLWTFLYIEGVEPTNNLAERALRPAVIFRKLSGGNQSNWGARFTERLMTVVCTLRQNAMNTFIYLTEVFMAYQAARSPPKLTL